MEKKIARKGFAQINIVVKDIEKAAAAWADLLGIETPKIFTTHLEGHEGYPYTYRGEMVPADLLCANIEMDGFVIELHQPVGGESSFQEFIEKHGNGVHHIGFEVGEDRDEIIREMSEAGIDTGRTYGAYPGSSWTIVDTEDLLGVNLNIKPKA